jgi:hypothetical protein
MGRYGKIFGRGNNPLFGIALMAGLLFWAASNFTFAARVNDIRQTLHNLSVSGTGTAKATTETQVCVFCHTPHAATAGVGPIWNKTLSSATYTTYTSSTLDSISNQGLTALPAPNGSAKLCLSCHDGTLAVGNVNVLNGKGSLTTTGTIAITTTGYGTGGVMPAGDGTNTGFTRYLGTDLTNDHPISVTLNAALSAADGEIRAVDAQQRFPAGTGTTLGVRGKGYHPKLPLEPVGPQGAGQIECATCHDPHIRETDATMGNQKFLRLNRFQEATPTGTYNQTGDIICLTCHDRDQGTGAWANSVHADPQVANSTFKAAAATQRQFPTATALPVWKAACLNCHDTHTVQGARRLLREGTDSTTSPKQGGNSAIEQTCYQCHTTTAARVVDAPAGQEGPPNVFTDFNSARHMPITTDKQGIAGGGAAKEQHDISSNFTDASYGSTCSSTQGTQCGKDFLEPRVNLGAGGNLGNRHVECTDCHNPHRIVKFQSIVGGAGGITGTPDAEATHPHTATTKHTNIASGVSRGIWGVEPVYASTSFYSMPSSFTVKRGSPGNNTSTAVTQTYLTREYQICLKCHSNYGYDDNNVYPTGNRPNLGASTPSGTNNLTQYTNQSREFQAPSSHAGEGTGANSGAGTYTATGVNWLTNNHRGWHPVMMPTGRTGTIRGNGTDISNNWYTPWRNDVGNQTMYCTDCHGSNVSTGGTVVPDGTAPNQNVWGPHGSSNDFVLKGLWDACTGTDPNNANANAGMGGMGGGGGGGGMGATPGITLPCAGRTGQATTDICFKCHDYTTYANGGSATSRTGFYITPIGMAMCMGGAGGMGGGMGGAAPIDGHKRHYELIGRMHCTWCHVAVPHGWKNKALLVNLNDVGAEAGFATSTEVKTGTMTPYNQEPYYLNAHLKTRSYATSGTWNSDNCGSAGRNGGNGAIGVNWMANSTEACINAP